MTISAIATAADFTRWAKEAKAADLDTLKFVVRDCREAAEGMRGWNADREGYYIDQSFTYADELNRRLKKGAK